MKTPSCLIALACLLPWPAAHAQAVYRCGNSYSQQPCPGGRAVDTEDRRTAEQRRRHDASVQRERRAGNQLETQRLREEAAVARSIRQAEQAQREAAAKAHPGTPRSAKKRKDKDQLPAYRVPPAATGR